jgi:transcriptional regulator with XRE-family HTH domain
MEANNNTFRVAAQGVQPTFCSVNPRMAGLHNTCMPTDLIAIETGTRLRRAREAMGLTQKELAVTTGWTDRKPDRAQRLSLSPSRIGNFEQGVRRIGHEEAAILERVFHIPAPYFMGALDPKETDVIAALRGLRGLAALGNTAA